MSPRQKIPNDVSIYLRYLHQESGIKISQLVKRYSQYSERSIYRHAKLPVGEKPVDQRKFNKGRPRKLDNRAVRKIIRTIPKLREEYGSFSSKRVKLEASIPENVSNRCVRRCLNRQGYHYRKSRKKGVLSRKDLTIRKKFAAKVTKKLKDDFWTKGISFYLDGVGFVHKVNPKDEARSTKTMLWRKAGEGLSQMCTSKGKK